MNKVTYFDVEYANTKNRSICQIGILCEDFHTGDPFYPELDVYINPEDGFDNNCIKIHGITEAKVADKPNFPTVWIDLEKYFTNSVIIGHNVAAADLNSLVRTLKRYNIDIPELYYICTLDLAREYVPRYCITDYSMSSLCEYFDIDMDSEHNAFDDACACSDLFKALLENYKINPDSYIKKYVLNEIADYSTYISSPVLRKSINEFYGVIRGFSIDNEISHGEAQYIKTWKCEHEKYSAQKEISSIIRVIDGILSDGIITADEITILQGTIKSYIDIVSTSSVTLATQILDGILKGITVDGQITESECKNLRQWLYDNIYLSDHYPFDKAITMVDKVLEDSTITPEESLYLTATINEMLNPVDSLKSKVNTLKGQHVCLSGNFAHGSKQKVEEYITEHGGIIDSSVKKSTNILLIGNYECQSYSNGTYGTKVKKAIEYNEKGCNIQIVKEADLITKEE